MPLQRRQARFSGERMRLRSETGVEMNPDMEQIKHITKNDEDFVYCLDSCLARMSRGV